MISHPFKDAPEKEKSENNNIGSDEGIIDNKMRCPICGSPMHKSGQLQMTNPSTGRKKMVQVYYCGRCGYKTLG
jgi:C4-type Zn-finger protein